MDNIVLNKPTPISYDPGYPVDASPGSNEKGRTAWGKYVLEIPRLYRLLNSSNEILGASITAIENAINTLNESVEETLAEFRLRMQQIIEDYTLPVGTIIMFNGDLDKIPKKWSLCNGENGTPDLRDVFVQGAGGKLAKGQRIEAGLPNIVGWINNDVNVLEDIGGAFRNNGANNCGGWKNSSSNYGRRITLDASRSSGIYGRSDTVQPPAVALYYIMKVA